MASTSSTRTHLKRTSVGEGSHEQIIFECKLCHHRLKDENAYDIHAKTLGHCQNVKQYNEWLDEKEEAPPSNSQSRNPAAGSNPTGEMEAGRMPMDLDYSSVSSDGTVRFGPDSAERGADRRPSMSGFQLPEEPDPGISETRYRRLRPREEDPLETVRDPDIRRPRGLSSIADPETTYYPFKDSATMDFYAFCNCPNLVLSNRNEDRASLFRALSGSSIPPTRRVLKELEAKLVDEIGVYKPTTVLLSSGHNLTGISPLQAFKADFATPEIRSQMQLYPILNDKIAVESYQQFPKTRNLPRNLQPPMVHIRDQAFYVQEIGSLQIGGREVVVYFESWYSDGENVRGIAYATHNRGNGIWVVRSDETTKYDFNVDDLSYNVRKLSLRLEITTIVFILAGKEYELPKEHSDRTIAGDSPNYVVPAIISLDDYSGNITKKWNAHLLATVRNGTLPASTHQQRRHVRFVATSKQATPHDIAEFIIDPLDDSVDVMIEVFDCETGGPAFIRVYNAYSGHDGPMGALLCAHSESGTHTFPCRRCWYGGSQEERLEPETIYILANGGKRRSNVETLKLMDEQREAEIWGANRNVMKKLNRRTGVKDKNQQARFDALLPCGDDIWNRSPEGDNPDETSDVYRRYHNTNSKSKRAKIQKDWEEKEFPELQRIEMDRLDKEMANDSAYLRAIGFDCNRDTVQDLLHVGLLGIVKYKWGELVKLPKIKEVLTFLLRSMSTRGISVRDTEPNLYVYKARGLVGRDYKLLVQLAPMFIAILKKQGLVSDEIAEVWFSMARLLGLLYRRSVSDRSKYTARLRSELASFYHACFAQNPLDVLKKLKYHSLTHVVDDSEWIGLPSNLDNETIESLNGLARQQIQSTNKQNVERDVSTAFANLQTANFIFEGGKWLDKDGKIRRAGPGVRAAVEAGTIDRLRGIKKGSNVAAGTTTWSKDSPTFTTLESAPEAVQTMLDTILGPEMLGGSIRLRRVQTSRNENAEIFREEDFVLYRKVNADAGQERFGKIDFGYKVWQEDVPMGVVYSVSQYEFYGDIEGRLLRHARSTERKGYFVVVDASLETSFYDTTLLNTHHDCINFGCSLPTKTSNAHKDPHGGVIVNLGTFHSFDLLDTLRPDTPLTEFTMEDAERVSQECLSLLAKDKEKKDKKAEKGGKKTRARKKPAAKKPSRKTSNRKGKKNAGADKEIVESEDEVDDEEDGEEQVWPDGETDDDNNDDEDDEGDVDELNFLNQSIRGRAEQEEEEEDEVVEGEEQAEAEAAREEEPSFARRPRREVKPSLKLREALGQAGKTFWLSAVSPVRLTTGQSGSHIGAIGVAVPVVAHKALPGDTDLKADLSKPYSSKNGFVLASNLVSDEASTWQKIKGVADLGGFGFEFFEAISKQPHKGRDVSAIKA
ncbi:hypothetical protein JCM5350_002968 [Sporobolomyces pararoseus]